MNTKDFEDFNPSPYVFETTFGDWESIQHLFIDDDGYIYTDMNSIAQLFGFGDYNDFKSNGYGFFKDIEMTIEYIGIERAYKAYDVFFTHWNDRF